MENVDTDLFIELQKKEAKLAELVDKVSQLRYALWRNSALSCPYHFLFEGLSRDLVPNLFDDVRQQATKRAKTREMAPTTPAKPKPSTRAETPVKVRTCVCISVFGNEPYASAIWDSRICIWKSCKRAQKS
jgi:hypothetical protein